MKHFLLQLILACGMFATAFSQTEISKNNNSEVSDKWVITPIPTLKGVLGRLDINFPADIERTILIYQQSDNKFLTSVSRNDKIYPIAPGEYRFAMTNVPIDNVPIKKGHETRLKAGFLDIVSEGGWNLYDETKEKAYTSGNKPKKLALPVGRYQIKLGGQFYPVIIKDGETVEDSSPVEETQPQVVGNESNADLGNIATDPVNPSVYQRWVITDLPGSHIPGKSDGILDLNFMGNNGWSMRVTKVGTTESFELNGNDIQHTKDKSYELAPGKYDIRLNNVLIENVPIENNKKTRLKAGIISINYITAEGPILNVKCYVYNKNEPFSLTSFFFMTNGPLRKIVPAGSYGLRVWGDYPFNSLVIKDKENRDLLINTSTLTINSSGTLWRLCHVDPSVLPCYFIGGNGTQKVNLSVGNYKIWYGNQSIPVSVNATTQNTVSVPQ